MTHRAGQLKRSLVEFGSLLSLELVFSIVRQFAENDPVALAKLIHSVMK